MKSYIYPAYLILFLYERGYTITSKTSNYYVLAKPYEGTFRVPNIIEFLSISQLSKIFSNQNSQPKILAMEHFFYYLSQSFPIAVDIDLFKELEKNILE